jgi:hypothetical protein
MGIFSKGATSSVTLQTYAESQGWFEDGGAYSKRLENTFATLRSSSKNEILLTLICRTEVLSANEIFEEDKENSQVIQVMPLDEDSKYSICLIHRPISLSQFVNEIEGSIRILENQSHQIGNEWLKKSPESKSGLYHLPRMLASAPIPILDGYASSSEVAENLNNSPLHPLIGILRAAQMLGYERSKISQATEHAYTNLINKLRQKEVKFENPRDFCLFASKALEPAYKSFKHPTYNKVFWDELVSYTLILNGEFENIPNWW